MLKNQTKIIEVAEEYAHGGIKMLIRDIDSTALGNFQVDLEKEIFDFIEEKIKDEKDIEETQH